ncbi:DUF3566 domain-containing protein [Nocardiopsis lucentensis]|uniref:DUF3566 domain-containing protein n=1 Tax=Nocardiopsis lucentensis TaxID=53441 RepID=UPI000347F7A4|nr:DUF3566 domain-containing protein [Nocardiopsis lucentensis]
MSDNQRNTPTNESEADTAVTAGDEAAEKGTVEATEPEPTDTETAEAKSSEGQESTEEKDAEEDTGKASGEAKTSDAEGAADTEPEEPERSTPIFAAADQEPEKDSVEDRAEAGETAVTDSKASVPEGPGAVKATMSSRKAHLTVSRVEPWSVMKFSFVVSLVCFIVLFVAVAVIYATLSMLGVFDEVTSMMEALLEGEGNTGEGELGLDPAAWFSPGRVLGYTGVIGALNIVLITALSTVGAMVYNLVADLVGGVDVTLTEAE